MNWLPRRQVCTTNNVISRLRSSGRGGKCWARIQRFQPQLSPAKAEVSKRHEALNRQPPEKHRKQPQNGCRYRDGQSRQLTRESRYYKSKGWTEQHYFEDSKHRLCKN